MTNLPRREITAPKVEGAAVGDARRQDRKDEISMPTGLRALLHEEVWALSIVSFSPLFCFDPVTDDPE